MYSVDIKNSCSCAIKRALPELQSFDSQEEAEAEANRLLEQMQDEFCKKHRFELRHEFGNYSIYILANT
jgi:redox-regulated HSP33 family molecular chaperone